MKRISSLFAALLASTVVSACAATAQTEAGKDAATKAPAKDSAIYSNMEEVYFDGEAKKDPAPWTSIRFSGDKDSTVFLDAYGRELAAPNSWSIVENKGDRLVLKLGDRQTELRRANNATCWGAVRKTKDKPDGSPDWVFKSKLTIHDQGGRVLIGGGDTGHAAYHLRIRRVTWEEGSSSRPTLVLYVHTPDAPDKAVSYSWANVEASRVGINLRWMQASCTIDGAERRRP